MAKELKPRHGSIDRSPQSVSRDADTGGQIAEPKYNPELHSEQQTPDLAQQVSDNTGQTKWTEDGSGWMADKLEGAMKDGAKKLVSSNKDKGEQSNSETVNDVDKDNTDLNVESESDGEDASVEGQNVVSDETVGVEVDTSEEEAQPTIVERVKSFAKNAVTQNPISRGLSKFIGAGMSLLTGAGLGTGMAAVVFASTIFLTVATVGITGAAIVASNNVRLDTQVVKTTDCSDEDAAAKKAASDGEAGDTFSDEQQLENVKKIYSVLKEYGLTDIQIAGAVANMQQESGINPRRIEAMNSVTESDYQKANKDGSTVENLFGSWGSFVSLYGGGLSEAGYLHDGKHWMGVGIIQWTGGSNYSLWKWSQANKLDMWSLDTQLTAMLSPESGPYADRLKTFVEKDNSTPEKAAVNFLNFVEYAAGHFTPGDGTHAKAENRQKYAAAWYVKIKEMQVDKAYAKSILDKVSSSIKAASDGKTSSAKAAADDCNDKSTSYGGTGWQKKEGVYSGNNGGWQVWKYNELPDELKKYAIDPRSLGMKYNSSEGWMTGAGNYIDSGITNQCTTFSAALMGILWEKDGKPLGMNHGLSGNGDQLVGQMVAKMGVKSRKEPVSGDLISTGTYNHTQVVSHVFENGDILVIEQNVTGYSGQGAGGQFQWNYQYVTKAKYEADKYTFASPESVGYKINPKAKSVG